MASIRRPQSPSRRYPHSHPFSSNPNPLPSSPLRHSSFAAATSPRHHHQLQLRRPLLRYFLFFFLLGFALGLLAFLTSLSPDPPLPRSPPSDEREVRAPPPEEHEKLLIVVTASATGPAQAPRLHRLAQTLRLVPPPLLWLVAEQGDVADGHVVADADVAELLRQSGVVYRHIVCCGNASAAAAGDEGVKGRLRREQRNEALELVERHRLDGIVYFADDENVYSLDLFQHLREVRKFGAWPVSVIAQTSNMVKLEGPVCKEHKVDGWFIDKKEKLVRRFYAAISGFAFNSTMLWDPILRVHEAWNAFRFLKTTDDSLEVTNFIEQLVEDESQMEGLTPDCSKIMNWSPELNLQISAYPKGWKVSSNLNVNIPVKL